jgi:predicted glycogen debranching enzyme
VQRLVLTADQFIVRRSLHDGSPGHSVLAGYHWFADWGRDTMISLPGLALVTGRADIARSILRAFAEVITDGLVPNRFPDVGDAPEFNSVDATFWFVEAVAALDRSAPDEGFLRAVFPVLEDIFAHLCAGTRYGIALDPSDGLIRAGVPGMQLTWMDARVNGHEVTPRIGKPVEINALWISNLRFLAAAAPRIGRDPAPYTAALAAALAGFGRFWNPARGFLFDVLDGPDGHEAALRPNQILACRAATGALDPDRVAQVLAVCEARLWTPCGLRSLAEDEAGYRPRYDGPPESRDGAYHMGTVWAWLIGPFIEAHLDLHDDPARALRLLEPLADQLRIGGLGTVGEIFEAAPPHAPRGCIAQAWSVAEILRAWSLIAARKAITPNQRVPR